MGAAIGSRQEIWCGANADKRLRQVKERDRLVFDMDPVTVIEEHATELRALGARKIGVFGSFARGEQTAESDVDVYLEFAEGMKSYDNFFAIHELLEALFGRRIDLVTEGSLRGKARIILPTVRYAAINP